jgi:hypothetical protein
MRLRCVIALGVEAVEVARLAAGGWRQGVAEVGEAGVLRVLGVCLGTERFEDVHGSYGIK